MSLTVRAPVMSAAGWAEARVTAVVTTRVDEEPPSIAVAAAAPPPAPSSSAADSVAAVREGRRVRGIGSPRLVGKLCAQPWLRAFNARFSVAGDFLGTSALVLVRPEVRRADAGIAVAVGGRRDATAA